MAFQTKTDPWGISGAGKFLTLVSVTDNKSSSVAEARDEKGNVVATTIYGVQYAPSYEYKVSGSGDLAIPKFGAPVTASMADGTSVKLFMTNWTLNTGAGSETTFSITAGSIPSTVTAICPYQIDCGEVEIGPCQHAKLLFSCATLSGAGCYLQTANYAGSCTLGRPTKDGDAIAAGVTDGRITAALTILQTGTAAPTLASLGTGWEITSPLTCTNPDAANATWTATLTKYLAAAAASS